jgi:hypothetical protein
MRVSHRTIERLVEADLLKREQVTPRAPSQIRRGDLDTEPIRRIIDCLHCTGKLILQGNRTEDQLALFTENKGNDNARYHEWGFWPTYVIGFSMTRLLCMRLGTGQSSAILESLHIVRRVGPISGEHLV